MRSAGRERRLLDRARLGQHPLEPLAARARCRRARCPRAGRRSDGRRSRSRWWGSRAASPSQYSSQICARMRELPAARAARGPWGPSPMTATTSRPRDATVARAESCRGLRGGAGAAPAGPGECRGAARGSGSRTGTIGPRSSGAWSRRRAGAPCGARQLGTPRPGRWRSDVAREQDTAGAAAIESASSQRTV